MSERPGIITMKGNPLSLTGQEIKVGDNAPDVTLVANDHTGLSHLLLFLVFL